MEEEGGEQEISLNEEFIAPVTSVNGKVGDVVLKASDLENDTNYQNGSQVAASIAAHNESDTAHADIRQTLAGKQDQLSADQLNAVNSGIDSTKVAQIATNTGNISTINGKIPNQATPDNQLADKAFVNSSVQTATANFRGSWANWAAVPNDADDYPADYSGSKTPTVNDYLVLQDASDYTEETLTGTWRFKYSGTWTTDGKSGWYPEYQVNETPLTAAQLAALNSNITAALTQKLQNIEAGAEVNKINGVKVNGVLLTPDSDKNVDVPVPTDFYTKAEINAGTDNLSVPSGFFSDSAKTVSATGNPVALTGTSEQVLSDVRLLGDSFQQTYAGKSILGNTVDAIKSLAINNGTWNGNAYTKNGVTYTLNVNNGMIESISLSGTASANSNFFLTDDTVADFLTKVQEGQNYTLSGCPSGGSPNTYYLRIQEQPYRNLFTDTGDSMSRSMQTLSSGATNVRFVIGVDSGTDSTGLVYKPMFESGSSPTSFEPYVGGIPAPNPDYPQDINVVTGTQTITLNDGGSNTRTATVRLGSLELVKIGDYQDYIWNDNGTWKKHKAIESYTLPTSGYTKWEIHSDARIFYINGGGVGGALFTNNIVPAILDKLKCKQTKPDVTTYYNTYGLSTHYGFALKSSTPGFLIQNKDCADIATFESWISANPVHIYYILANSVDETITDATLIADLNALLNTKSFSPNTNASSSAVSPNLPAFLTVEAFKNNLAGILAGSSTHIDRLEARVADLEANP